MTPQDTEASELATFDALPLSPELRRAIDELGYTHPTPVQREVYEPARRGRDLVVQARTGTGKTAAFGLPIIDCLVKRSVSEPQALVLCPTRELALQVTREFDALAKHRGVRTVAIYGGAPMPAQVAAIRAGAQVVVGTPGRMLDHLRRGTVDPSSLRVVVLDESDEMLSMGFLPQIDEILGHVPRGRQTLLFSATLPSDIRRLAETRLREPEFITLSGDQIGALEIQHFVYLSRGDKADELVQVLEVEDPESAIVFCNTRDETKRVAAALQQQGFTADWLNGDLAQSEREKVMEATRLGKLRFLVATDVAARGIDISHLTHVINHDFPESPEAYVHRTGRTGRAGRTGTAISLVAPSDVGNLYMMRLTYKIRPIEKQLPSQLELKTRAETDLVSMFAELFASRQHHPDDLALARRLLTHADAERVVAGLLRDHLGVRPDAPDEATAARRSRAPAPVVEEPQRGEPSSAAPMTRGEPRERARRARREGAEPARPGLPESDREPAQLVREAPHESPEPEQSGDVARESEPAETKIRADLVDIYVNVGRKDGARPGDYHAVLRQHDLAEVGHVRVRPRHTFVGVPEEYVDRALAALRGSDIAGKRALAEIAKGNPKATEDERPLES
jgi:ATP-dependent RNA helicase DeaD